MCECNDYPDDYYNDCEDQKENAAQQARDKSLKLFEEFFQWHFTNTGINLTPEFEKFLMQKVST